MTYPHRTTHFRARENSSYCTIIFNSRIIQTCNKYVHGYFEVLCTVNKANFCVDLKLKINKNQNLNDVITFVC